ncbi:MAG TPA: RNA methyltransferase [Polyangia bacterium]
MSAGTIDRPNVDVDVNADVIAVDDPEDPRLHDYRQLKEHTLKAESGKFIAESEPVVRKLLASGLPVHSLLVTPTHFANLAPSLRAGFPIFVADPAVLDQIAGFHVHRGCLAVGGRPLDTHLSKHARTAVVLEDLVDVDNVGAMVRNSAAFGADAVVLSPRSADPFYRKAIRVSMGTVFAVPILRFTSWPSDLAQLRSTAGLSLVGTVLDEDATPISEFRWPDRVALLFGSEGPGLSQAARALCDHLVTIPMARDKADSLNVATAGALFLHARSSAKLGSP